MPHLFFTLKEFLYENYILINDVAEPVSFEFFLNRNSLVVHNLYFGKQSTVNKTHIHTKISYHGHIYIV